MSSDHGDVSLHVLMARGTMQMDKKVSEDYLLCQYFESSTEVQGSRRETIRTFFEFPHRLVAARSRMRMVSPLSR